MKAAAAVPHLSTAARSPTFLPTHHALCLLIYVTHTVPDRLPTRRHALRESRAGAGRARLWDLVVAPASAIGGGLARLGSSSVSEGVLFKL